MNNEAHPAGWAMLILAGTGHAYCPPAILCDIVIPIH